MLHLPLWQHPQHRIAEQSCQPLPAFLLKPWHTVARQKWSNAHYSIFFTQFILMSAYSFPVSASPYLATCACCLLSLQSDGTAVFPTAAYAHFSSYLIISSFSLLSCLLPSNLFFHLACHSGATASSSPSFSRTCWPHCFHCPFVSWFSCLLPSSLSIKCCLNISYLLFQQLSWSHDKVSFLFVLPHPSPFHSITTDLLPMGFVPPSLSYFLRLILSSYEYVYMSISI